MYAEPLTILDSLGKAENHSESFTSVSSGDTLELAENYLIGRAFDENNGKRDIFVEENGSLAAQSDYEVDLRDGTVTWNGATGVDLDIRYKIGPVPNEVVVSEIESAQEQVDEMTNTTFDGYEQVTHTYDHEEHRDSFVLFNRPVHELVEARHNKAKLGDADNFKQLDLGRDGDIFLRDDTSVQLTPTAGIPDGVANLEITYKYGYDNVPAPINKLVRAMTERSLLNNTVLGEVMDGRDDYGVQLPGTFINEKQEIIDNWSLNRFGEPVPAENT